MPAENQPVHGVRLTPAAARGVFADAGSGWSATMEKIKIEQHTFSGTLWFAGWLFAIGYLHLTFWKGVLAIVLWPYYLGLIFRSLPQ
jgi:hypothetical protein